MKNLKITFRNGEIMDYRDSKYEYTGNYVVIFIDINTHKILPLKDVDSLVWETTEDK